MQPAAIFLMIGHKGHPEVIGTMGQLQDGSITLIETVEDAEAVAPAGGAEIAYITQTTLSVDDTLEILKVLKRRFPSIRDPEAGRHLLRDDTNRQEAVKAIAGEADVVLVIGAPNSSNSKPTGPGRLFRLDAIRRC